MIIPIFPSFRTVVGPFLWRFGMVTDDTVDGRQGWRDQRHHIERANRENIQRDDREILEILTTFFQCRN